MERATGLEPTTTCLEGRSSSQLSYTRTTKMEALYKKYEFCQNFLLMMIFSSCKKIRYTIELFNNHKTRKSMGESPQSKRKWLMDSRLHQNGVKTIWSSNHKYNILILLIFYIDPFSEFFCSSEVSSSKITKNYVRMRVFFESFKNIFGIPLTTCLDIIIFSWFWENYFQLFCKSFFVLFNGLFKVMPRICHSNKREVFHKV